LLDGSIPELRLTSALGNDVDATRRSLAALFFSVEPDFAQQFLLSQPIHDALAAESSDELRALASVHREAFWLVLEQLLEETDLWVTAPKPLAQAASRLCEAGLLPASELQTQLVVTQKLVATAQSQPFWTPFDDQVVQGLLSLLRLSENKQTFIVGLFQSIANTPIGTDGQSTPANTWSASFYQLIEGISDAAPSVQLTPIRVPVKDPDP